MRTPFSILLVIAALELNSSFKCGLQLRNKLGSPSHVENRQLGAQIYKLENARHFYSFAAKFLQSDFALQAVIDTQAEDVSAPLPSSKTESVISRIWRETTEYLLQFKNAEFRKKFSEDMKYIFTSAFNNVREGDVGKRGEELFLAQMVLVTFVVFGVPAFVSFSIKLVGILATSGGFYFISRGVYDLRQNLTPFVTPIAGNQLVTTGIYSVVRHPLYTGLIFFCLGVSIFSDNVDKAVLTVALAYFLDKKADREEEMLNDMHPLTYQIYTQKTKKLLPTIY